MAWMKSFFVLLCIAVVAYIGIVHHSLLEIGDEDSNAGAWSAVREKLRTVYFISSSITDRISAQSSEYELTLRSTDRILAQSSNNELAQKGSGEHKTRVLSEADEGAGSQHTIDSNLSQRSRLTNQQGVEAAVEATVVFFNMAVKPVLVAGRNIRVAKTGNAFVELVDASDYWGAVRTAFRYEIVESFDAYLFTGLIFNDYSSVGYSLLINFKQASMQWERPSILGFSETHVRSKQLKRLESTELALQA